MNLRDALDLYYIQPGGWFQASKSHRAGHWHAGLFMDPRRLVGIRWGFQALAQLWESIIIYNLQYSSIVSIARYSYGTTTGASLHLTQRGSNLCVPSGWNQGVPSQKIFQVPLQWTNARSRSIQKERRRCLAWAVSCRLLQHVADWSQIYDHLEVSPLLQHFATTAASTSASMCWLVMFPGQCHCPNQFMCFLGFQGGWQPGANQSACSREVLG